MKSVELSHYTDGLRVSRIVCHDDAVDEAICSLVVSVVEDWYRSMDHSRNPVFLPVARDLASVLGDGYDRSVVMSWISRHRSWMPGISIVDLGPCDVAPGRIERLLELSREIADSHPA